MEKRTKKIKPVLNPVIVDITANECMPKFIDELLCDTPFCSENIIFAACEQDDCSISSSHVKNVIIPNMLKSLKMISTTELSMNRSFNVLNDDDANVIIFTQGSMELAVLAFPELCKLGSVSIIHDMIFLRPTPPLQDIKSIVRKFGSILFTYSPIFMVDFKKKAASFVTITPKDMVDILKLANDVKKLKLDISVDKNGKQSLVPITKKAVNEKINTHFNVGATPNALLTASYLTNVKVCMTKLMLGDKFAIFALPKLKEDKLNTFNIQALVKTIQQLLTVVPIDIADAQPIERSEAISYELNYVDPQLVEKPTFYNTFCCYNSVCMPITSFVKG